MTLFKRKGASWKRAFSVGTTDAEKEVLTVFLSELRRVVVNALYQNLWTR